MECDRETDGNCGGALYVVATERPSDPSEIVSVIQVCANHAHEYGEPRNPADVNVPWTNYMLTSKENLQKYIESSRAAGNGHLFLTI